MNQWLRSKSANLWSLAGLLVVAIAVFAASRGTSYHRLGIGLVTAAIVFIVAIGIFEAIWQSATAWLNPSVAESRGDKSRSRRS